MAITGFVGDNRGGTSLRVHLGNAVRSLEFLSGGQGRSASDSAPRSPSRRCSSLGDTSEHFATTLHATKLCLALSFAELRVEKSFPELLPAAPRAGVCMPKPFATLFVAGECYPQPLPTTARAGKYCSELLPAVRHVGKCSLMLFPTTPHVGQCIPELFLAAPHVRECSLQLFPTTPHVDKCSSELFPTTPHVG